MRSPMFWLASTALFLMLALAGWQAGLGAGAPALPRYLHAGVLMLGGIGVLFGLIFWVVYSEDVATRREAARCR